jgi:hypothetical protein
MFSRFLQGFDDQILHTLSEQPFSYIAPALTLIGITIWFTSHSKQRKLSVPFFGDGNLARAQQRWMTDSINLLREGVQKVLAITNSSPL